MESMPYASALYDEIMCPNTGPLHLASWSPDLVVRTHAKDPCDLGVDPSDAAKHCPEQIASHIAGLVLWNTMSWNNCLSHGGVFLVKLGWLGDDHECQRCLVGPEGLDGSMCVVFPLS